MRVLLLILLLAMATNSQGVAPQGQRSIAKALQKIKRLAFRHSVGKGNTLATWGTVALLLYGSVSAADVPAYEAQPVQMERESQGVENKREIFSLYFGGALDYLPESGGAYITDIDGVPYQRFGDYYGESTSIREKIGAFAIGMGVHVRKGLEAKAFSFFGYQRSSARDVLSDRQTNSHIPYGRDGMTGGLVFAVTHSLFGIDGHGFVGPSRAADAPFA